MPLKILYHGTDTISAKKICYDNGIDLTCGSSSTDFAKGFYTTDDSERARKWALRKARVRRLKPAIVTLYFDEESARNIIKYFSDDLNWGRFIINNRNGFNYIKRVPYKDNNIDGRYEITCGRVADINVTAIADKLKNTGKMLNVLTEILNIEYPIQYAFHSVNSLKYIKRKTFQNI